MGLHLITFYILQNYQNNYNDFLIKIAMLGEQKKKFKYKHEFWMCCDIFLDSHVVCTHYVQLKYTK